MRIKKKINGSFTGTCQSVDHFGTGMKHHVSRSEVLYGQTNNIHMDRCETRTWDAKKQWRKKKSERGMLDFLSVFSDARVVLIFIQTHNFCTLSLYASTERYSRGFFLRDSFETKIWNLEFATLLLCAIETGKRLCKMLIV